MNKYDSGWSDGVFLGVAGMGIGVLIGTKDGIVKTTDYWTAPEWRRNRQFAPDVSTAFDQYILPTAGSEAVVIDSSTVVLEGASTNS